MRSGAILLGAVLLTAGAAAQQAVSVPQPSAPDPTLELATDQIGRALFLRCFCAEDSLSFDAAGHLQGAAKTTDWTLAAVNVLKVERRIGKEGGAGEIELDGVRVAIRYAADRNEFDRHPQNTQKVKILIADSGNPRAFQKTLDAVFATGIDKALQRAMPEYWRHYFNPKEPWDKDDLSGQMVLDPAHTTGRFTVASASRKAQAGFTATASADRVQGTVLLGGVVDTEGDMRRIFVEQPLGYGLDAKAVEAAQKFKFAAATLDGKPIAQYIQLRQEFLVVNTPQ